MFEKVQKKLKENARDCQKFQATKDYVLTGKFFCGDCGSQMIGESCQKKNGKIFRYYKCSKRKHDKGCKTSAIGKDIIEDYVCLSNKVNIDKLSLAIHDYQESKSPMVQNIEARIGETTKKMNNIISAIEAGLDSTDLKSRFNELKGLRG